MMRRCSLILAAAWLIAGAAPAFAASDELDDLEPVSDAELAQQRGGFAIAGMEVSLGAEIRTFLDNQLVLQTNVSWTPTGVVTNQAVSGALTEAGAAQLQAGILNSGGISMRVGNETVFLANEGQTAIMHRTENGLQNVIVNTANEVAIRTEVDAVLDLSGTESFQADMMADRISNALADMAVGATIGGLED
jgi:hypothetical protein